MHTKHAKYYFIEEIRCTYTPLDLKCVKDLVRPLLGVAQNFKEGLLVSCRSLAVMPSGDCGHPGSFSPYPPRVNTTALAPVTSMQQVPA